MQSILNITGMAIGMACAIILLLWVWNEISYDRFQKNVNNLYRVTSTESFGGRFHQMATTPFPLAAALKEEYPEIIRSTRYHNMQVFFKKGGDKINAQCAFIDKDFFDMFDIRFVYGDKLTALTRPYEILVTEDFAYKYFGDEDPMGKSIIKWPDQLFTVAGVIKNVPRNSHFYFDCVVSDELYCTQYGKVDADTLWGWQNVFNYTFIELLEGANSKLVEEKIKDIIQRKKSGANTEIFLQNIRKIHLNSQKYEGDIATGNIEYVKLASLLAVLILAIACINFMNLLTAQSSGRAKEIGVRKMAGATRRKIMVQFLGESLLIVFVAHIIAMILVELLLPGFNLLMHAKLEVNYLSPGFYVGLFNLILFCGFSAGSYPAVYLSSLKPLATIRGMTDNTPGKTRFRKTLVISQFVLSFMFIICTIIVRKQLDYISDIDLGQNINNIGYFEIPEGVSRETLKNELGKNPDILKITIANTLTQSIVNHQLSMPLKLRGDTILLNGLSTDKDYASTFQLKIMEGKFLSNDEFVRNESGVINIVINEKAKSFLGIKDIIDEDLTSVSGRKFKVIGVVKDFHYRTIRSSIEPLMIFPLGSDLKAGKCYIRMKPGNITSTVNSIGNIMKILSPGFTLELNYLKDDLDNLYFVERLAATVLGYMTFLAIVISCLGLIGLSTFMTVLRTKEIGIRKANGARSGEIFSLFSKEYFKLVLISFIIASPVAWYATNIWLRGYAYRTNIDWWVFALAWGIVMVVTILTVGFQSYRAAGKNPVEALRYE